MLQECNEQNEEIKQYPFVELETTEEELIAAVSVTASDSGTEVEYVNFHRYNQHQLSIGHIAEIVPSNFLQRSDITSILYCTAYEASGRELMSVSSIIMIYGDRFGMESVVIHIPFGTALDDEFTARTTQYYSIPLITQHIDLHQWQVISHNSIHTGCFNHGNF